MRAYDLTSCNSWRWDSWQLWTLYRLNRRFKSLNWLRIEVSFNEVQNINFLIYPRFCWICISFLGILVSRCWLNVSQICCILLKSENWVKNTFTSLFYLKKWRSYSLMTFVHPQTAKGDVTLLFFAFIKSRWIIINLWQ